MRSRTGFLIAAAAMTVAVVIGVAMLGFFRSAPTGEQFDLYDPATAAAVASSGKLILAVILASTTAGVVGWIAMYCLRRDGSHRMESMALLPINVGGRCASETSDWRQSGN